LSGSSGRRSHPDGVSSKGGVAARDGGGGDSDRVDDYGDDGSAAVAPVDGGLLANEAVVAKVAPGSVELGVTVPREGPAIW
jgi:hypothetical protein